MRDPSATTSAGGSLKYDASTRVCAATVSYEWSGDDLFHRRPQSRVLFTPSQALLNARVA